MYDPQIGQFISEDPSGFDGLDENLRRYVKNTPLNATDPDGRTIRHIVHGSPENDEQRRQLAEAQRAFESVLDALSLLDKFPGVLGRACRSEDFNVTVIWVNDLRTDDPLSRAAALSRRHGVTGPVFILDYTSGTFVGRGGNNRRAGFIGEGGGIDRLAIMMIVVAHELGHALAGLTDPGVSNPGGGVVTLCEEPLRRMFNLPRRPFYGRHPLPDPPPPINPNEQQNVDNLLQRYPTE